MRTTLRLVTTLALGALALTSSLPSAEPGSRNAGVTADIPIRDPFIVPCPEEGAYWMVGTGGPRGFSAWRSTDLERWTGPTRAFDPPPAGFWADRDFWAPEIHSWKDRWYLFASFKSSSRRRGTQILVADRVAGPYAPWSDGPVTPPDRECLDGTLFVDAEGTPWMVFCHEWTQIGDGAMCAIRLSPDLKAPLGEPIDLFRASQASWTRPFGDSGNRVTDGPFLWRASTGELLMLWSSFRGRYALGIARSASGKLDGPWTHDPEPLFEDDGGHGMLFRTFAGDLRLVLHAPNGGGLERARIFAIRETKGRLAIEGKGRWTVVSDRLLEGIEAAGRKPAWPGGTTGVAVDRTTGEAFLLVPGEGVWRTADRGGTFRRVDGGAVGGRCETGWAIHADPRGGRMACFMLDGPSALTLDGGKSWSPLSDMGRGWDYGAVDWTAERPSAIFAARHESGGELYLSADLGRTWRRTGVEPKVQGLGVVDAGTLLLHRGEGIERSTDGGATWSRVSDLEPASRVAAVFRGTVWWVGAKGLIASEDRGVSWALRGRPADLGMGPFFGADPKHMLAVGKGGFLETLDGGATWTAAAPLPRPDCRVDWFGNFAWDPVGDVLWFANMGQPAWKLER